MNEEAPVYKIFDLWPSLNYPAPEDRSGSWEGLPHVGVRSSDSFAGAAVKRDLTSKVSETQVRR